MRTGIFFGALLATALFGGTALAERQDTDTKSDRGRSMKEQVLEKQREGFAREARVNHVEKTVGAKQDPQLKEVLRGPRGDLYGDQAQRTNTKTSGNAAQSMTAANDVNTPSEIRAMKQLINPMHGAYRTCQAAEGTDSYGSESLVARSGGTSKSLTSVGSVNTPKEIEAMLKIINPMQGAYRMSAAAEGTDSYGGAKTYAPWSPTNATTRIHFKNDKGEVIGAAEGKTDAVEKAKSSRAKLDRAIEAKLSQVKAAKTESK